MATYKVLQDIEAEDKLLGPLTLKQFIFAAITIGIGYIQFVLLTSSAPILLRLPFIVALLAPMLVFGFLAAPIGQDQPNDIWLFARLRFLLVPHKRIWNQDGISNLVTITAPKKEVHTYTNGLSQTEVKSRLQALADTVDSRGWAVKNVNTNLFAEPGYLSDEASSDRLVSPSSLPQDVPAAVVTASDDMLDPQNNPTAQHLDQLVQASAQAHRQQIVSNMKHDDQATQAQTPTDYWFMNQSSPQANAPSNFAFFDDQQVISPGATDANPAAQATAEEEALASKLAQQNDMARKRIGERMHTIQPLHDREGNIIKQPAAQANDQRQSTPNPAIIGLAHNDDLNVATIARQAKEITKDDGEVVISLH